MTGHTRRTILGQATAAALFCGNNAMAQNPTAEELKRQFEEYRAKARANFPFELIEVEGRQALTKWQELKSAGRGVPVILGGENFDNILEPFGPDELPLGFKDDRRRPLADVLAAAAAIKFPDDLIAKRKADNEKAGEALRKSLAENPSMPLMTINQVDKDGKSRTLTREETLAAILAEHHEPPLGKWPARPDTGAGLSVVRDLMSGSFFPTVHIVLVPTDDWATVPAHLRWGGWNENPGSEWHVAALRSWRDRYGAELIGLSFDVMNLRVAHRPKTRDEALSLAREQYAYCNDLIEQGMETFNALAGMLTASDWWYFWWD